MRRGGQAQGRAGTGQATLCFPVECNHKTQSTYLLPAPPTPAGSPHGRQPHLPLLQLLPVDALEEGVAHDVLGAAGAVAQALAGLLLQQALDQALHLVAQVGCNGGVRGCGGVESSSSGGVRRQDTGCSGNGDSLSRRQVRARSHWLGIGISPTPGAPPSLPQELFPSSPLGAHPAS